MTREDQIKAHGKFLEKLFKSYKYEMTFEHMYESPSFYCFAFTPARGTVLSRLSSRGVEFSTALRRQGVRIITPIPNTGYVGVEVPKIKKSPVLYTDKKGAPNDQTLPIYIGIDNLGNERYFDLTKSPHMLVGGTTGSGKSVFLNSLICSLIEVDRVGVQLTLVDPKEVEFQLYEKLGLLKNTIISKPEEVSDMLRDTVEEMDYRFLQLKKLEVKSIDEYNKISQEKMSYHVIIIDEFSDIMESFRSRKSEGNPIESYIVRLAQKSRAVGIHLVLATQRPSVDVVTGLIKANFPTRISFRVRNAIDSRTILDVKGAEELLGDGDMFLSSNQSPILERIQGAYISDRDIKPLVSKKAQPQKRHKPQGITHFIWENIKSICE